MISDDFQTYSNWNGIDALPAAYSIRINNAIKEVHAEGEQVRLGRTRYKNVG